MRYITDTEMIAGYIVTWGLICAMAIIGLMSLIWLLIYPIIVMMMTFGGP